jgi:amidase
MAGTTESALHGDTSTPWKPGHSAGGSTGGGMAAVIQVHAHVEPGPAAGHDESALGWRDPVGPARGRRLAASGPATANRAVNARIVMPPIVREP